MVKNPNQHLGHSGMTFDDRAVVHFRSAQTIDASTIREVAIWSMKDNPDVFTLSVADAILDHVGHTKDYNFQDDEEHSSLHHAYASFTRSLLVIPL